MTVTETADSPRVVDRAEFAAIFPVAVGLVALHVVDDNFLQPQPGTSQTDHLVSGLVPLALLLGAAVVYGRARAGVRATLALLLGFFGVVSGTEAVYYSLSSGPSGDDFTGFLSMFGGFVLLAIGAVTIWRSRRADGSRLRRYLRRSVIVVGVLLLASQVLVPAAIAYVVTHTARAEVPTPNLGAVHEDVAFTTADGIRLEGWFVPSQNGATVIAFPGRSGPQKHARMLVRHGYGVLLFDRRGEGASEGDPNIFGWHGERDLHAAPMRGLGESLSRLRFCGFLTVKQGSVDYGERTIAIASEWGIELTETTKEKVTA